MAEEGGRGGEKLGTISETARVLGGVGRDGAAGLRIAGAWGNEELWKRGGAARGATSMSRSQWHR
jgi:hypothetical protein